MRSAEQGLRAVVTAALLALAVALGSPAVCPAAEDHHGAAAAEHHEGGEHHVPGVGELFFPAINFSIYLVILVRFVIPAMREYLRRRHSEIVALQAESSSALARAEADLAAAKARLASLGAESESIRQDLVTIAARQGERLKAQAEETGARRLADAALLAEQERRRAFAELRGELARAASDLAETKIRGALTAEDQRSFVRQFLKEAGAR